MEKFRIYTLYGKYKYKLNHDIYDGLSANCINAEG